jgi:hypothetical protein
MSDLRRKVEVKYDILKEGIRKKRFTIDEIDDMTCELISFLAILTDRGVTHINQTETVDRYKERVWNIVEKVGLLPEL